MALLTGECYLRIQDALGTSFRNFRFGVTSDGATATGVNRAGYKLNAGQSFNLNYNEFTSGLALNPGTPGTILLRAYYETGLGTIIRTLHNAAPPPLTPWTFFATDTGLAGGNPIAGTLRLFMQVTLTGTVGGLGDYNRNTDGTGGSGLTAAETDNGYIIARYHLPAIAVSAYPSGAKFAYGPAGDEVMTFTLNNAKSGGNAAIEQATIRTRDNPVGTIRDTATRSAVAINAVEGFSCDNTYPTGNITYDAEWLIVGTSPLTLLPWTEFDTTQPGVITTAQYRQSALFIANPDILFANVATGETIYNTGELADHSFKLRNSRNQLVTRSMSWTIRDSLNAIKATRTDSGSTYGDAGTGDYTILSGDDASVGAGGNQWTIAIASADARATNQPNIYLVSQYLSILTFFTGKTDTEDGLGAPTGLDSLSFFVGADALYAKVKVLNVRGEVYAGAAVTMQRIRGSTLEETEVGTTTNVNGWQTLFYQFDVTAPAGARIMRVVATQFGNSTGPVDKAVTFVPSYTGNLGYEATYQPIVTGTTSRIVVVPIVLDATNYPQLISEANATLDYSPRLWVRKRTTSGVPPRIAGSPFVMTPINPPGATEDDAWEYELTGLTAGDYVASVIFQLNGGQVPPRADFDFTVAAPLLLAVSIEPAQRPDAQFTVQVRATIAGAGVAADANPVARVFYDRQKLVDPEFAVLALLPAAGDTGTYRESFAPGPIGVGTFSNIVDLYEVEVSFIYGGVTYRAWAFGSAAHILTAQEYAILAQGGNADGLHTHSSLGGGGGTPPVAPIVVNGEPVSASAWEAALFDPDITDAALAEIIGSNLAPGFAAERSIRVLDRRDGAAFKCGDSYVFDNGGRGQDGAYLIARKEPDAQGRGTWLSLNRVRSGVVEDLDAAERRIGTLQRKA